MNRTHITLSWTAVLLWMALIFILSAQPAQQSDQLSQTITDIITESMGNKDANYHTDIDRLNHMVRKYAHFFSYLVLGILVMNGFRRNGVFRSKAFVYSIALCLLYAISDEVHQLYVQGRGAHVKDVIIDCAGALTGVGIHTLFGRMRSYGGAGGKR